MKDKIFKIVMLALVGLTAGFVYGTPTGLATVWSFSGSSWTLVTDPAASPAGTISQPAGTTVTINFGAGLTPIGGMQTTMQNGDWSSLGAPLSINFTLKHTGDVGVSPADMIMYFTSSGGTFTNTLAQSALGTQFYTVPLLASSWNNAPGFSLTGMTDLGFVISANQSGSPQSFEFSNMQFMVPEPETLWMIVMVLASLGITFRGRLSELAGQVKARIKA